VKKQNLAHNVYFTLKDSSDEAIDALIEECNTYLKDNPGILYFSAGSLVKEHDRDVNIRDFHVGLHVVFENKSFHDKYQDVENHITFVERNKDNWTQVMVFDTYVS
jgi:hypothetical protein